MNSYFHPGFKSSMSFSENDEEMIFGVPSEYVCIQPDLMTEAEDSLFHMPSNDTFQYFNTSYDLISKSHINPPKLDYKCILKSDPEDESSNEIVMIEEVAEQEVTADPLHIPSFYPDDRFADVLGAVGTLDDFKLTCELCNLYFDEKRILVRHISSKHKRTATYECSDCGQIFCRKRSLISHLKSHDSSIIVKGENSIDFQITIGTGIYKGWYSSIDKEPNITSLSILPDNTKIKKPKRKSAQRKLPQVMLAQLDDDDDDPISRLTCSYCGKICKDYRGLKKHSAVHSDGHYLRCHTCGKQFCTRTALRRHMLSHQDKNVKCDICGVKVADYRALANHRSSHHAVVYKNGSPIARIFPCHSCDKIFSSRTSQQIHLRVHTGERPYSCRYCVKAFADGGTLKKHERIHTGEKPYVCPICSKASNQRVVLREHIRIHHTNSNTTDKDHKCEVCNEVCDSPQNLCSHLVKHADENTAKQRIPLERPRKYKKWKKSQGTSITNSSNITTTTTKTTTTTITTATRKSERSSTFSNQKALDDFLHSSDNIKSESEENTQPSGYNHLQDVVLVTTDKTNAWTDVTVDNSSDKTSCSGDSYQSVNAFPEKLPIFCDPLESCDSTNSENSCFGLGEITESKSLDNHFSHDELDERRSRSKSWGCTRSKFRCSLENDICVHSGLGVGATVELQNTK